ncbi:MAG: hypothetical protein V3S46_03205 [Nitrospinota bacterium]
MNHKLSGNTAKTAIAVAVLVFALTACWQKIPGDPKGTLEKYIKAVQQGDFKTIYALNQVTARQKKYLEQTTVGDVDAIVAENYRKSKSDYDDLEPVKVVNIQWGEKYFFPPSASVAVGKPKPPAAAGDDTVNAEYERAGTVNVQVSVVYTDPAKAPEIEGKKVKSIDYLCTLVKIREGKNVRVYSHDENWFFGSCIEETPSASYY